MKKLLPAVLPLLMAGCAYLPAIGPDYQAVKLDLPDGYREAGGLSMTSSTIPYWERLGDPTLVALEQKALGQSLTLKRAWQRIKEARAGRAVAASALGPQAEGQGGYEGRRIGAQANLVNGTTQTLDIFSAGVGAAWELDIFGGNRRALEGASARAEAAKAGANAISSAVMAEVARQYLTYRALRQQVELVGQQVSATETLALLAGHQARVGMVNGAVPAEADARAAAMRMQLAPLQAAVSATQYHLESLLGEKPGALAAMLASPSSLPVAPPPGRIALPSQLILQRPDLRMQEREVAAATADIGVAMADLFPRFSLTGSYGVQGPEPGGLSQPSALVWNGGPSFRWTLLAMGRVWNNIHLQKARQRDAVLAYQQAALNALAEVEAHLAGLRASEQALAAAETLSVASERRAQLAREQHDKGAISGLPFQQALFMAAEQQKAVTQSRLGALLAYIDLHQSLGL